MKDGKSNEFVFWVGVIITLIVMLIVFICGELSEIKPIHVYQGRTTLEYRVRDGQVIDSIVVWREEE